MEAKDATAGAGGLREMNSLMISTWLSPPESLSELRHPAQMPAPISDEANRTCLRSALSLAPISSERWDSGLSTA